MVMVPNWTCKIKATVTQTLLPDTVQIGQGANFCHNPMESTAQVARLQENQYLAWSYMVLTLLVDPEMLP